MEKHREVRNDEQDAVWEDVLSEGALKESRVHVVDFVDPGFNEKEKGESV